MQGPNWNDLRYFLALHRTGTLKQAGRLLGTSETTVARRVKALEQHLGTALFLRGTAGRFEPTDAARDILDHAEAVETQTLALQSRLGQNAGQVTGTVRISSVPIIVNRILVPALSSLMESHPRLTVDLAPVATNLDLSKREADLAVRFARPTEGGLRVKAQKLGALAFDVFGPRGMAPADADLLRFIAYEDTAAHLPQARWIERALQAPSATRSCLRVADVETALEAVACGLGKSLLPRIVAQADPRLEQLLHPDEPAPLIRDVWLLSHADQSTRSSVMAAKAWLATLDWS